MRKIIVTGATSMIGVALIREAIKRETEVLAVVRKHSPHMNRLPESKLLKVYECDLSSLDTIDDVSETYDVFYHMGWGHTSKDERDNPILQEPNIKYTLDAVNLAKRLGCRKFIGAGSQAEYGKVDTVITPDTPVNPLTAYGMAKYSAGILSGKLCKQLELIHIWTRIFSVYGCYDREGTMINYAMDRFLKGETAKFSSGEQMWDYLYEDDAGRMFYLIGELVNKNQAYCIASGESKPLKEYIMELRNLCQSDGNCEFAEQAGDHCTIGLQADINSLVQDIGYKPGILFREGIQKILRHRKSKYFEEAKL